jgi:FtsP/CotA-like multicopper oxidase with cupredoxin domain
VRATPKSFEVTDCPSKLKGLFGSFGGVTMALKSFKWHLLLGLSIVISPAINAHVVETDPVDEPPVLPPVFFEEVASPTDAVWSIGPEIALDRNADPDIVEINLVAGLGLVKRAKGRWSDVQTKVWTYNGSTPGPTIEAKVGDTVIVHFRNDLPEETTVHWHGVELPANMDGSHISQTPVPPGGYFRYEFKVQRASLFWYHPHIRGNEQVEKGLYGALLVRDSAQDEALGLPEPNHVLMLDDVLLNPNGTIKVPFPADPKKNAKTQVNGREGNLFLVNGLVAPTVEVARDEPLRLRFVNTSNMRFMRVSIPGHVMYRIGGDGGLLEEPIRIEPVDMVKVRATGKIISNPDPAKGLLLTPGERADIVFAPKARKIPIEWHDFHRGRHTVFYKKDGTIGLGHNDKNDGDRKPRRLLTLIANGPSFEGDYSPPAKLRTITPVDVTKTNPVTITSMFGHTFPDEKGDVTFFMQMKDGMPLPFQSVMPQDAPTVKVGDTVIWEVHNLAGGAHNFHLHGFTFQLLETEFLDMDTPENNRVVPAPYLEDKDTIFLPGRTGARGKSRTITRLALTIDDAGREGQIVAYGKAPSTDLSGGWVVHCHLLEHSSRGMMSFLQVVN